MVATSARGKKLKCQNEECALPFYDLNVAEPDCPTCGTAFDHEAAKELVNPTGSSRRGRQAPVFEIVAPEAPGQSASEADDNADSSDEAVLDIDEDAAGDGSIPDPKQKHTPE